MTGKIKVGDYVTWGHAKNPGALKIVGCRVLALTNIDGKSAALLDCGRFGEALVLVCDLTIEEDR